MTDGSERDLIETILVGDERALRAYYAAYKSRLQSFVSKRIDNNKDAEEIVQDVFLASLDALRDFKYNCTLNTFICSIASHKIIDFYRKQKVKNLMFSQLPEDFIPLISKLLGPEEEFDLQEIRGQISVVFSRLSLKYQQILKLKYIEGLSMKEISSNLEMTIKSVESMIFRARQAFIKEYSLLYC